MNIFYVGRHHTRFLGLLVGVFLCGSVVAQFPNPDATLLFSRSPIGGTARTAGAGGAFSSVGADIGSIDLNPAGLGLFNTTDICITPGIKIAADRSNYDGTNTNANHVGFEFAQAGAVITKKINRSSTQTSGSYALKSISFGISFQADNFFGRDQSFGTLNNTNSLVDNFAYVSNQQKTNLWSLEAQMLSAISYMGQNSTGTYTSNMSAPVHQSGTLSTRGTLDKVNLGFGGNLGEKIFFGFSVVIPILNYSVNTVMLESNANPNDSAQQFQGYQMSSTVSESGAGVTGKVGLIYKPVPWARFGVSYSLPTWYFLSENYSSEFTYYYGDSILDGSVPPMSYTLRTPMKGMVGASFYLQDHGFISADYEFQNIGSTRYSFTDPAYSGNNGGYNSYMKSTYGYSHTVRVGIEGAIKKLRLRAGYAYTNSPFRSGQNYTDNKYNASIQSASVGIGGRFKSFYIDLAYVFSYTKDGVSPNSQIPLDQINSILMTHTALLTVGFKIPTKGMSSTPPKQQKRSSDQLPRYIDPGDKY